MAGNIFINYRRGDDPGFTGRLFDRLQEAFKPERLFMDVDNIAPGLDFVRVLEEKVAQCDVLLAVIGRGWTEASDATGARRLDNPDDFVRIEIESALKQNKRVIPVVVGEARMPRPEELPEAIRPLARRNAVRLTHERFRADAQGLVKALQQAFDEVESLRQTQAEALRQAKLEEERKREEEAASARAKAQRDAKEEARREKEQARLNRAPTRRWLLARLGGLAAFAGVLIWTIYWNLLHGGLLHDDSIRTFTGPTGGVHSVAFSPDGRTALSGNVHNIMLWGVATGKELLTWDVDISYSVAFSPDGLTALSGSWGSEQVATPFKNLNLLEIATGKVLRTFTGHRGVVYSVSLSPDGRTALSGSDDKTLKLWELATGKELRTFTGHENSVLSVTFSPDGRTALSGSADNTLKFWEVATGKVLRTVRRHLTAVKSVAFSPDGRTALSGSKDRTLKLWEVATGEELRTFTGHKDAVNSVAFSPDGRSALSGSDDQKLKLWDLTRQ
jgi:sugar lactone lactonase YvrE